jgi:hypothetical protein
MKQTAVEFLYEALFEEPKDIFMWQIILQQAKEIERMQIKDAYSAGVWEIGYYNKNADAEEYYNKTYKQL